MVRTYKIIFGIRETDVALFTVSSTNSFRWTWT